MPLPGQRLSSAAFGAGLTSCTLSSSSSLNDAPRAGGALL